jgi:hypothetical protein
MLWTVGPGSCTPPPRRPLVGFLQTVLRLDVKAVCVKNPAFLKKTGFWAASCE